MIAWKGPQAGLWSDSCGVVEEWVEEWLTESPEGLFLSNLEPLRAIYIFCDILKEVFLLDIHCFLPYLLPDSREDDEESDVESGEHRHKGDRRNVTWNGKLRLQYIYLHLKFFKISLKF